MTTKTDLIIDAGMCDGADTAYYLYKGYRVLAIDADPLLCTVARERFSDSIGSGLLEILNVGIAAEECSMPFYRNLTNPGHSSFNPELGRAGGHFDELQIPCVPLAKIIKQYGAPHYLKIDIEGYDELALSTLTGESAPSYISVELTHTDSVIQRLAALGYQKFKLINQGCHTSSLGIMEKEWSWRLLRKMSRTSPWIRSRITALPHSFRPKTEWDTPYRPDGWDPCGGKSSGPFGEEAHGSWLDFRSAIRIFDRVVRAGEYVWWDVHARR